MAPDTVHSWDKRQEIGPSGRFSFRGDASVRFAGPGLAQIVLDIASTARPGSIGDVVIGAADASGWKAIRPAQHSWAWLLRRPRPGTTSEPDGIIAILIGLALPGDVVGRRPGPASAGATPGGTAALGPAEQQALRLLRPYLAPGARLLIAGHKFTLESHAPASFGGYDAGFTGGVFVATGGH